MLHTPNGKGTTVLTTSDTQRIDQVLAATDECLIALEDGREPERVTLDRLPPWRRALVVSLGEQLGIIDPDDD